ncbi:helix-turn-helix transcriptional regulator [Blastococcus sp. SYSU DS0828]
MTPTRWVREREAAQVTGFAPGTLRQWRHHGRGPAFHRVGRTVLYDRAELHRFVMAGRVEMASAA